MSSFCSPPSTIWQPAQKTKRWPVGFDTNLLIGWDIGLSLYLAWTFQYVAHCTTAHMRREAVLQDEGSLTILFLVIVTAALSMVAIIVSLGSAPGHATHKPLDLLLLFVTIVLSWSFIQTIFALHYAHEFYAERHGSGGGLVFPDDPRRTIGISSISPSASAPPRKSPTSMVTSRRIRRTVVLHSMVAFVFNVTVLALMVNLASAAIAGS